MALHRPVALRALLLAVVAGGMNVLPNVISSHYVEHQSASWLPTLGTVGQTVLTFTVFARLVSFLAIPVGALVLGYWATSRLELVEAYREYVSTLLVAGAVGLTVGTLGFGVVASGIDLPALLVLATIGNVGHLAEFVLAAFAGAAFTEIRAVERAGQATAVDGSD